MLIRGTHSRPSITHEGPTKVIFCPYSKGWVINDKESIELGAVLDRLLFYDENLDISTESLLTEFESRLSNVCRKTPTSDLHRWALEAGWAIEDALCALDPAEDIDETNWLQRGYFRRSESLSNVHTCLDLAALERKWGVNNSSSKPGGE